MIIAPKPAHQAFYTDLTDLLRKHASQVQAVAMLAIAAQMVGKIAAMQDQRKITPAMAMDIIASNIELGNKQVIDELSGSKGRA